jgi:hypothetical protein
MILHSRPVTVSTLTIQMIYSAHFSIARSLVASAAVITVCFCVNYKLFRHLINRRFEFQIFFFPTFYVYKSGFFRAFENRVLRRLFGHKRDEVTGGCRKLRNEELHGLYSRPSILGWLKQGGWDGRVMWRAWGSWGVRTTFWLWGLEGGICRKT